MLEYCHSILVVNALRAGVRITKVMTPDIPTMGSATLPTGGEPDHGFPSGVTNNPVLPLEPQLKQEQGNCVVHTPRTGIVANTITMMIPPRIAPTPASKPMLTL